MLGALSDAPVLGALSDAPVLGALSDRFGRRPLILTASVGLRVDLVAIVWMVFRPTLWVMVLARIVHAVSAAIGPTAMAYIADVTPPKARTRAFGRYLAVSTGIIVGPALAVFGSGRASRRKAITTYGGRPRKAAARGWADRTFQKPKMT